MGDGGGHQSIGFGRGRTGFSPLRRRQEDPRGPPRGPWLAVEREAVMRRWVTHPAPGGAGASEPRCHVRRHEDGKGKSRA